MFNFIKSIPKRILEARLFVLCIAMVLLFSILLHRIFMLQVVNGKEYLDNYTLLIRKERVTAGTRGSIYDRNGKLLAYNELSYSITIEDNGVYKSTDEKNRLMNEELNTVIHMIEEKGDTISNSFSIQEDEAGGYSFTVSGKALQRFLADVYGHTKIEDLRYNKKLGYDEADATPEQVMEYLQERFGIHVKDPSMPSGSVEEKTDEAFYTPQEAYKITFLRYAISQNSFQKYVQTTIAQNVHEETVAVIKENSDILQGVDVMEDSIRKYEDSVYFPILSDIPGRFPRRSMTTCPKKATNTA